MFHVQAALFDAWACYRDGTTGIFIDIDGLGLRDATATLSPYRKRLACLYAMCKLCYITPLASYLCSSSITHMIFS